MNRVTDPSQTLHQVREVPILQIPRSIYEDARDAARALGRTEAFEQSRRDRKRVEMLFAHLKRILKFLADFCFAVRTCTGRVHARCHRAEPTSARQVPRSTTASARRLCRVATASVQRYRINPLIMGRVALHGLQQSRPLPSTRYRRLLQQNPPEADVWFCA